MSIRPLNRRVVEQMSIGVATRRDARSLEPVPAMMRSRGTSKSAVSRRFVAKTAAQLAAWQTASLEALDLVGLLIDGVPVGEPCLIVALGIAADGLATLRARDQQLGLAKAEEKAHEGDSAGRSSRRSSFLGHPTRSLS